MNTLIFGFGFLGRPLAEALWQRGTPVRAVKRRLTSDDINLPLELDALALNPSSFLPAWTDCRAWVFLLPPAPLPDYAATIGALARTAAHCGAAQLVFGSSISVYGDRARECNEHSPPEPATASAHAIVAAEQACLASGVANIDILRFGGLYAAERHPVHSLLKRQNNTGANRPVNMVHRDLAVAALLRALDTPNGVRVRNIVEPAHPRKAAFYAAEAAKLGLPAPHFADHDDGAGKTVRSAYRDLV